MQPDPFVIGVKQIAIAHRRTKALLEWSANRVAKGIRKNIDQGRNASGFTPKGAPGHVAGTPMTPLSGATVAIRESKGRPGDRPFYDTGYTYNHIGGWLGDATQIRVGGTTPKARDCIKLNYGTEVMGYQMAAIRGKSHIKSYYPDTEIPPRNPIGYTRETANAIFSMWHDAMLVGDKSHSRFVVTLPI